MIAVTERLTVAVLTLNEEKRIGRLLESLPPAVDLLILDSYSTDQTLAVVRQFWAEQKRSPEKLMIHQKDWRGFREARNETLRLAEKPWILWVDADEWLSPELQRELGSMDANSMDPAGLYSLSRLSYFLGHAVKHGGWYPDFKDRLAFREAVEWNAGPHNSEVHEELVLKKGSKKRIFLSSHLFHEPFLSSEEQRETNRRYSKLLAEGLAKEIRAGRRRSYPRAALYLKPIIKFFENYFWKLGVLDGRVGLLIAWGSSQSMYWRLQHTFAILKSDSKST
jgi:glycosyltransferase involved in cell wall biosynthesis